MSQAEYALGGFPERLGTACGYAFPFVRTGGHAGTDILLVVQTAFALFGIRHVPAPIESVFYISDRKNVFQLGVAAVGSVGASELSPVVAANAAGRLAVKRRAYRVENRRLAAAGLAGDEEYTVLI